MFGSILMHCIAIDILFSPFQRTFILNMKFLNLKLVLCIFCLCILLLPWLQVVEHKGRDSDKGVIGNASMY